MASQGGPGPLMARPGLGTKGFPGTMYTNAFVVKKLPDFIVFHYDVAIRPDVPTRVKRQVFNHIDKVENGFGGISAVFDGQKNCYAPRKLGKPFVNDAYSFEIELPEDDEEGGAGKAKGRGRDGRRFHAAFKLVAQVNLHELAATLGGRRMTENCLQAINVLNVMIRHAPSLLHLNKGPSIYPEPKGRRGEPNGAYTLSGGLELWRGYFSSIRPSPRSLIVNIDSTSLPLVQTGNLVEVAAAHLAITPQQLGGLLDRDRIKLDRFLKGVKVQFKRTDNTYMRRKIKAVSPQGADTFEFALDDGKKTTIAQYFKKTYNVTLRGPRFPCVRLSGKAWYPMELCFVCGGNRLGGKLGPDQVAEALKFTTNEPMARRKLIQDGLQLLNYAQNPICNAWGFSIDPTLMEIKTRTLEPPKLKVGNGRGGQVLITPREGMFDLRGKHFFRPAKPPKAWGVLVFNPQWPDQALNGAIRMLIEACGALGLVLPPPAAVIKAPMQETTVVPHFRKLKNACGKDTPELVVCFVEAKNKCYPAIKIFGDIGAGVATQCLQIPKMRKMNNAYFSNVALKINIKLRGINIQLDDSALPNFSKIPTMIVGSDVTHPGPKSMAPSIASVVGSFDLFATSYQAETDIQSSREEIIKNLEPIMVTLIKAFATSTKKLPKRIIFYRDGVSEGQYETVYSQEVAAVRRAYAKVQTGFRPDLTYVICAKRHHFRFFPKDRAQADRSGNAKAGTVVDTHIAHPTDNDFYLQSHAGLLGTSRPTHYHCLLDENALGPDVLQGLTYALCYAYARCTRSVSLCAPAYFSHHCATRARFHLGTAADDMLDASTVLSSRDSSEVNKERNRREAEVRAQVKPIHTNIKPTLYFM